MKKKLDKLRKGSEEGSHVLVHDVPKLHAAYQERLDEFEKCVKVLVEGKHPIRSYLLRKYLDVPEEKSGSLLILAVKNRQLEAVKYLTGHHELQTKDSNGQAVTMVEPNARDPVLGRTALYEACSWGDVDAVKCIMNYKQGWQLPFQNEAGIGLKEVNIVQGDREKETPLMVAIKGRYSHIVEILTSVTVLQHHPNVAVALRNKEK